MRRAAAALALVLAALASACDARNLGLPFDFERMLDQPRYDPYAESPFFENGMAMRAPPDGALPYRPLPGPGPFPAPEDARAAASAPVTRALLEEGRGRFEVFCAPCHGADGFAQTPVAESMSLRPPPSLHEARLRALSAQEIGRIVREGYGLMPSYAGLLSARQMRAVAEYVRVLQASQREELATLPPALQRDARRALAAEEAAP